MRSAVSRRRFAAASRRTAKVAKGTTFRFTLSEKASTRIAITETVKGHRASAKRPCGAIHRDQRKNCTRTITLVTLIRAHTTQGRNAVAFSGRYGSRKLQPGTYNATVTATDAAGHRSRRVSGAKFTVVA